MDIIVCLKQVPDPEAPPSAFEVDPVAKKVIPRGIPPVISPFDENALEAALRIKSTTGARITVVSMGKNLSRVVLSKALAAGANDMVLVQDPSFSYLDGYATARGIAGAIKKLGTADLILCGRQAADTDGGQVGYGIAEMLGIPCISPVQKIEVLEGNLRLERLVPDGYEIFEVDFPAVVGVSNELYEFRYVSVAALHKAQKRPVTVWNAEDMGLDVSGMVRIQLRGLSARVSKATGEIIDGETAEKAGANLALRLREVNVI